MYVFVLTWSTCLDRQPPNTLITFSRLCSCSLLGVMNLQQQCKLTWFILPLNLLSLVDFALFKFLWKESISVRLWTGVFQGHLQRNSSRFFIVANYTRRIILVSNPTYFPESCLLGHPECEYDGKSRSEAAKIVDCLWKSLSGSFREVRT